MSEYCEFMWNPMRNPGMLLARNLYEGEPRPDPRDRKLAIKTVRTIIRGIPDVDMKQCTDEYITRFLLARKYRIEQAAALIAAYQSQVAHRQDIFGNLTARDPALQRALRAGIPGVLPARDRKGRCVLIILASQWDPVAVPALAVQRAIFLVLEILIQDPRNQHSGFVAVVDWSGFSLRQGGALGTGALRNLISALRGRFPARFKAVHFLSSPLCVQATLAIVKPFLDEKTRNKIFLHGNNLSTLHDHLPTDILPAELGGTGPAFNPGLWAEPVIHSAMKEAELAAMAQQQKEKERAEKSNEKERETGEHDPGNPRREESSGNPRPSQDQGGERESRAEESRPRKSTEKVVHFTKEKTEEDESSQIKSEGQIEEVGEEPNFLVNKDNSQLLKDLAGNFVVDKDNEQSVKNFEGQEDGFVLTEDKRLQDLSRREDSVLSNKDNDRVGEFLENLKRETDNRNDEIDGLFRDKESKENVKMDAFQREDVESLESHSETNSNEFEMVPRHPESEDSKDSSLDVRVEKVSTRTGKKDAAPEEVNLMT